MSSKLLDPGWLRGSMLGCSWLSQLPVCGLLLARVTGAWLRASSAVGEVCVRRTGSFWNPGCSSRPSAELRELWDMLSWEPGSHFTHKTY